MAPPALTGGLVGRRGGTGRGRLPPLTVLATWAAWAAWAAAAWAAAAVVADDAALAAAAAWAAACWAICWARRPLDLGQRRLGEGAGGRGTLSGLVLDAQLGGLRLLLGQELGPGGRQLLLAGLHLGPRRGPRRPTPTFS